MKKKKKNHENYLERIPVRNESLNWETDENGKVTLSIENKGIMNRIAQICFKKPKISYIHLDEMGSFIWQLLDGEASVLSLGEKVEVQFGEDAQPLYERLAQYIRILESYGFIMTKRQSEA